MRSFQSSLAVAHLILNRPLYDHADDGTFANPWSSYIDYKPIDFLTKALPEMKRVKAYSLPIVS